MFASTFFALMGTAGFAILTNISWKLLPYATFGGALSWFIYLFCYNVTSIKIMSVFIAAIFAGIYAEIIAKILKKPATPFSLCAAIPLAPGAILYKTMEASIGQSATIMLNHGLETILTAGAIASGIALVASVVIMFKKGFNALHWH